MDEIHHKSALIQAKVQLTSSRSAVKAGINKGLGLMEAKFCFYQNEELTENLKIKGWPVLKYNFSSTELMNGNEQVHITPF